MYIVVHSKCITFKLDPAVSWKLTSLRPSTENGFSESGSAWGSNNHKLVSIHKIEHKEIEVKRKRLGSSFGVYHISSLVQNLV